MQRPGGRNRCPYMDGFPPWMAADAKRAAEWKEGHLPGLPWQADFGRAIGNAPDLGEHTDSVANRVLELSDADIAGLRGRGAFG